MQAKALQACNNEATLWHCWRPWNARVHHPGFLPHEGHPSHAEQTRVPQLSYICEVKSSQGSHVQRGSCLEQDQAQGIPPTISYHMNSSLSFLFQYFIRFGVLKRTCDTRMPLEKRTFSKNCARNRSFSKTASLRVLCKQAMFLDWGVMMLCSCGPW